MKTFEELKAEAIARGIKPGAVCQCARHWVEFVMPEWGSIDERAFSGGWWTKDELADPSNPDGKKYYKCLYNACTDKWATVITPAPEDQPEGLVDGMACEPDEHMRRAIVEKAKELGLWKVDHQHRILVYDPTHPSTPIPGNTGVYERHAIITPGEFYDRLCRTVRPETPLTMILSGRIATIEKGFITVAGFGVVRNEEWRMVAERLED